MAGSWIKFETSTSDKPEVWEIATKLNIDPDAVVGKLLRVWTWFDEQTNAGTNAPCVSKALLDRRVSVSGFVSAMIEVGWMVEESGKLSLPNFERHNGETAKKRALTAKRVAKHTKTNAECVSVSVSSALPREEKRREEKKNTKKQKHPFFENEEFSNLFDSFKSSSSKNHNWFPGEEVFDSWLYDLTRFSIDEAKQILRFSTSAGAKKPILNGDHKRSGTQDNENSRRGGKVSFDEGILT